MAGETRASPSLRESLIKGTCACPKSGYYDKRRRELERGDWERELGGVTKTSVFMQGPSYGYTHFCSLISRVDLRDINQGWNLGLQDEGGRERGGGGRQRNCCDARLRSLLGGGLAEGWINCSKAGREGG